MPPASATSLVEGGPHALLLAWLRAPGASAPVEQFISLNSRILDHLHDSHWPAELPAAWQERIMQSRRAATFLSGRLAEDFGWTDWFPWDSDAALVEIASLPPARIHRICEVAGACLASSLIRKTLRGDLLRELRVVLGEPLLNFVRLRAPYLKLPLVESDFLTSWSGTPAEQLQLAGFGKLHEAFSAGPPALLQRLRAKIPKSAEGALAGPAATPEASARALRLLTLLQGEGISQS